MANFQKLSAGAARGTQIQGTDIGSGAATSTQFLAANGSGGSAFRVLAAGDLPTITLTSDVTGSAAAGSIATTVAKIQGTTVSGTTGSTNVVFSASPTLTGTITAAAANFSGAISASNFSGSSSGTNSGDVTLSAFGSSPNANGASLSTQALTLQPASATQPGGVSTTTQSFAGNKSFTGNVSHVELVDSTTTGSNAALNSTAQSLVVLTNASLVSLSTIPAGSNGQMLVLNNQTTASITINNQSGSPTSAQITTGTGANMTLANGASIFLIYDNNTSKWLTVGGSGGGGSSSVSAVTKSITQTAHGFSVGNILYYTGSAYALAKADSDSTSEALGLVSTVTDANNFILNTVGYITGLSGLTAGTTFYLSNTSAGALTSTQPVVAGSVSKPMLVADSTTSGYVIQSRGVDVSSGGLSGPTNTYFNGYMSSSSSWSTSTTSFVDPTNSGGNALTTIYSNGITVTAAASNVAGITFTPSSTIAAYKITARCALGDTATNNSGGGTYRITDGTTVFGWNFELSRGSGTTDAMAELGGIYVPGTTSAVTVKIQINAIASTAKIFSSAFDSSLPSIQWEIIQIR